MNILIKWSSTPLRQIGKTNPPSLKPVWSDFAIEDISARSRDHARDLFNRKIEIVILEGNAIITNSLKLRNLYRQKGKKVFDLESIQPSDKPLLEVGFISG